MADEDFEKSWISKFTHWLDTVAGEKIRKKVLQDQLPSGSSPKEVVDWTAKTMERLDSLVDEETRNKILAGCGCQYPLSHIEQLRAYYEETNADAVHEMLQNQFEKDIKEWFGQDEFVQKVLQKNWGVAGVKEGNTIYVIKIPFEFTAYFEEPDKNKKRFYYCHCPRVREAIKSQTKISPTYCYCGAGYYKKIWEGITGKPVKVEVLKSVLQGDDVCKIAVYLPAE